MADQAAEPDKSSELTDKEAVKRSAQPAQAGIDGGDAQSPPHELTVDQNIIDLAIERALDGVQGEHADTPAKPQGGESGEESGVPDEGGDKLSVAGDSALTDDEIGNTAVPLVAETEELPLADAASSFEALAGEQVPGPETPAGSNPKPETTPGEGESLQPLTRLLARLDPADSTDDKDEVISSLEGRPIGKMTEDILRPLVREWLTDNLPSLAERLVREEF